MYRSRVLIIVGLVLCSILLSSNSFALPLTPGNIIISRNEIIYEYTKDGEFVQSLAVPYPTGSHPITESARDLVVDNEKNILVYNGTFDPYLSTYDSDAAAWSHNTYTGWSTGNNVTYGGIATTGDYVFVTDMQTSGDGGADEAKGIVKFDLNNGTATRFATDIEPIDLTMGLDDRLYALSPGGSPGGRTVNVYDPFTSLLLDSIDLTAIFGWTEHRSITVNANGEVLIADWDGDLTRIDIDGNILGSINVTDFELDRQMYDIDVDDSGSVIASNRAGEIIITNEDFSFVNSFTIDSRYGGSFVAFVPQPIPEPSTLTIFSLGLFLFLSRKLRKKRIET